MMSPGLDILLSAHALLGSNAGLYGTGLGGLGSGYPFGGSSSPGSGFGLSPTSLPSSPFGGLSHLDAQYSQAAAAAGMGLDPRTAAGSSKLNMNEL